MAGRTTRFAPLWGALAAVAIHAGAAGTLAPMRPRPWSPPAIPPAVEVDLVEPPPPPPPPPPEVKPEPPPPPAPRVVMRHKPPPPREPPPPSPPPQAPPPAEPPPEPV